MTTARHEAGPAAQLLRLVHLSTASAPNGPDVIEQLLQASIARNLKAGTTGVLCGGHHKAAQPPTPGKGQRADARTAAQGWRLGSEMGRLETSTGVSRSLAVVAGQP